MRKLTSLICSGHLQAKYETEKKHGQTKQCLKKFSYCKNSFKLHLRRSTATMLMMKVHNKVLCGSISSPNKINFTNPAYNLIVKWGLINLETHKSQEQHYSRCGVRTFCSEWPPIPGINERFILLFLGRGVSRWPLWKCSTILAESE